MSDKILSPHGARLLGALVALFGLGTVFLGLHPYRGIWHDAILYSMLALRHLEPTTLGADALLRYGSQGSFTAFPLLHAAAIRAFGLEPAAWLLTRGANVLWLGAALLLARRLVGRREAWLALAVLLAVPGQYGAQSIFTYDESFVTPRTAAEALILVTLWASLGRQWLWAGLAAAAAFVLHPIMAMPGILIALAMTSPRQAPQRLLAALILGVGAAVAITTIAPQGPFQFVDAEWRSGLEALQSYLLPRHWSLRDWQRPVVTSATLVIALVALEGGRTRALAGSALLVGSAGIALAFVADTVLPVALLVQGQAWRWMWIAKVVAVALLVPLAQALWKRGPEGRSILALVLVAWIGSEDALGLEAALCAILAAVLWRSERPIRHLWKATLALAVAFLLLIFPLVGLKSWVLVIAVASLTWWLVASAAKPWAICALALLSAAAFAHQVVRNAEVPSAASYDELADRLRAWQPLIAPDRNVLFLSGEGSPWLALHRQSYVYLFGLVFSRDATLEAQAKIAAITGNDPAHSPWVPATPATSIRTKPSFDQFLALCRAPGLDFAALPYYYPARLLSASTGPPDNMLYLYDCRAIAAEHPRGD